MGRKLNEQRQRKRKALFEEQGGLCYWCDVTMLLPTDGMHINHPPKNLATLDHLRDRFHPGRREPAQNNERRIVLACWGCNNQRGRESQQQQPIEELRRRSMRHPS